MKSTMATKQSKSSTPKGKTSSKSKKGKKGNMKTLQQVIAIIIIIAVTLFLTGIVTPQSCSRDKKVATPNNIETPAKVNDNIE